MGIPSSNKFYIEFQNKIMRPISQLNKKNWKATEEDLAKRGVPGGQGQKGRTWAGTNKSFPSPKLWARMSPIICQISGLNLDIKSTPIFEIYYSIPIPNQVQQFHFDQFLASLSLSFHSNISD